jgi:putative protease
MNKKQSNSSIIKKPELLAPAGDLARAKVAIDYGADAVYLGGMSFSLRSRASNFTMDDIRSACSYASSHGSRIHVTVNIIPHNEDFEGLEQYLKDLEDAGVTAIITASVSIMALAKKVAPKLEVHCSTQMSITNSTAAQLLIDENHVDRVVLSIECNMEEVREITRKCPVETEAFIHGGMCVNISGRCTLSNRMTLRDANRGGCAQSCRWQYRLMEDGNELSTPENMFTIGSKDMMAAHYIKDLMEAGVASLKIEGRMKSEYYVASIVSGYRHLIDELYDNDGDISDERMAYHLSEINKGENREVCSGCYASRAGEESIIFHEYSNSTVNHDFLGTVVSYNKDTQIAQVQVRNVITTGDHVEALMPGKMNEEFDIAQITNEEQEIIERANHPMELVTFKIPFEVNPKDILRKISSK